jgi:predicted PurR-regulated permease PerM
MGLLNDPERLLKLQRQLLVISLVGFIGYFVLQISAFFSDLLRILSLSLLVSYLVINAVDLLQRFLRNRAWAVAIVYLVLVGVAVIAGLVLIPAISYQIAGLVTSTINSLPELVEKMHQALLPLQQRLHERMIDIKVVDILTNFIAKIPQPDPGLIASRLSDMAMGTMTWLMYAVSISVVTFYFLLDGHRIKEYVIRLFPQHMHSELDEMATEMDRGLQAFFKGQIVLGMVFGLVMLFVYFVLHVQYALLLSVFLAICEVLPVIGPPIGFFPAIIAVAVHGTILPGERIAQIVVLTLIFMVLQQIKDSIVGPKYMGNVIGLHPVMIFAAIMVGARIDGMLGIILALPAAAVLSVIMAHLPIHARRSSVAAATMSADAPKSEA